LKRFGKGEVLSDVGQRNENNGEKKVYKCANQTFSAIICSSLKEHNSEENTFMGCQKPKTIKSALPGSKVFVVNHPMRQPPKNIDINDGGQILFSKMLFHTSSKCNKICCKPYIIVNLKVTLTICAARIVLQNCHRAKASNHGIWNFASCYSVYFISKIQLAKY
jgi:hypothetical protein